MATSNTRPSPSQIQSSLRGNVAILWDIENCPVPSDVRSEDVGGNIRMAIRLHPVIDGAVTLFSAYGDFNAFPRRLREGCQRTGVKLVDVPNGRKDAADKAILVDMFLFALDNPPPSTIMLISGDVDFAPALHILGQRGYTVILVIPSGVGVSSALSNAGRFVWDWSSVARGEGFVPSARAFAPRSAPPEISGFSLGCQISRNIDGQIRQNDEESIVYKGVLKSSYNTRNFPHVSHTQTQSEFSNYSAFTAQKPASSVSYGLPSGLAVVPLVPSPQSAKKDVVWVPPGDLNGLKGQLVNLLESLGGFLPLTCLPAEYQKMYGRPLYVSEYGALKLGHLLKKMTDEIYVEGKGQRKFVRLCNTKSRQVGPTVILARRNNKNRNGVQEVGIDANAAGSADDFSDDERAVIERNLEKFKFELQDTLVSHYSCRIFIGDFEKIYKQRYKRELDYLSLCVNNLEELLEKFTDVVALHDDFESKQKFLVAVDS